LREAPPASGERLAGKFSRNSKRADETLRRSCGKSRRREP